MKKYFKPVLIAMFAAGVALAAENSGQSSANSSRPVPGYIQKAVAESKDIRDLMDKVRAENDVVRRESLVSALRMKLLTEYAEQSGEAVALQKQLDASDNQRALLFKDKMEEADKKRLWDFDKQRDQLVQKITEARWEREMNIEVFVRNLSTKE